MPEVSQLSGLLRRIRRTGDLSQRQLADALQVNHSAIARAESGARELPVGVLVRAATLVGLRLTLLDSTGNEAAAMSEDTIRDMAGRHFPAHLDTRHADEGWWHGAHRFHRPEAWYTFDRDRARRDAIRADTGTRADHLLPTPGDSPDERRAARREAAWRERRAERERRRDAGDLPPIPPWVCDCPPDCAEDEAGIRTSHVDSCACRCDLG